MIMGWESSWAWRRILSRWWESSMGSISTEVGLVISGQDAATLRSLFEFFLHKSLFLPSNQEHPKEVLCDNNKLLPTPPPLHNCCCWSLLWYCTSLYKTWGFAAKTDILFSPSPSPSPSLYIALSFFQERNSRKKMGYFKMLVGENYWRKSCFLRCGVFLRFWDRMDFPFFKCFWFFENGGKKMVATCKEAYLLEGELGMGRKLRMWGPQMGSHRWMLMQFGLDLGPFLLYKPQIYSYFWSQN